MEAHLHIIEEKCSIIARVIINMLPSAWFPIYMVTVSAKAALLPNTIVLPSDTKSSRCFVPERSEEPSNQGRARIDDMAHAALENDGSNKVTF